MKKIRNLLPLIALIYSFSAFCFTPEIKTFHYYAEGGESLRDVLINQAGLDDHILDSLGYMKKISWWNRSIENQNFLSKGEQIYVEIPYKFLAKIKDKNPKRKLINLAAKPVEACRMPASLEGLSDEEVTFLSAINKKAKNIKSKISNKLETVADFLRIFKISSYYSLSRNFFEESVINTKIRTETNQDSPFTIGGSYDWQWDPNISFAGDFYASKMDEVITQTNKAMSLPIYYGATIKMGFKRTFWPFTMYGGIEHDSFASFNSEEIILGSDLKLRRNNLTGIGLGAKKELTLFGKEFLINGFYSQTILSSQTNQNELAPKAYKGTKFSIDGRMMYGGDWFYHAYYRQLDLEGSTILHIARFGLGFGLYF